MDQKTLIIAGLAFWAVTILITWLNGIGKRRAISKELKELKKHLHNQMGVNAKGLQQKDEELIELSKKNENLQLTLANLKTKTSVEEKQMLLLYDKAIHLMYERAPGFAPSWEIILKEAEAELDKISDGSTRFTKKLIRPSFFRKTNEIT